MTRLPFVWQRHKKGEAMEGPTGAGSLRDHSPLSDRPEWLSPRDLQEVFGIGRTKSFNICKELPHIHIGRCIRVHKSTIVKELVEKGRLA